MYQSFFQQVLPKFQRLKNFFFHRYLDQIKNRRPLELIMLQLTLTALLLSLASASPLVTRDGWKIPSTSFNSQATFNTYWAYNYPWGTDHNGAARMSSSKVSVGSGQVTLVADRVTGQAPTSGGLAIHYLSGTIYAKERFTVAVGGGYDFNGQFLATTAKGTWPAFWLTGADSWPPEIDLAEWKGSGKISFNSYGMNKVWITKDVTYANPGSWHTLKMEVRDLNGKDVQTKFYMNGVLQATQTGNGMVGKPLWL
jgi:galactan endo-beta-1,3-galactanase